MHSGARPVTSCWARRYRNAALSLRRIIQTGPKWYVTITVSRPHPVAPPESILPTILQDQRDGIRFLITERSPTRPSFQEAGPAFDFEVIARTGEDAGLGIRPC